MSVLIAKADGTMEPFEEKKLVGSLERSGADASTAADIASEITKTLRAGTTTGEIYRAAFMKLRQHRRGAAARYSLKRAVLDFGPSGFPFESYLQHLFISEGWEAAVDQMVDGKCVDHEVDLVLKKKGSPTIYVEAKFHNTAGFKTDLKTVLYVMARVEDIAASGAPGTADCRGMVVTNTKFTGKAAQYSNCRGLELLAWDDPRGGNLHDRIENAKLYPITALTTLGRREKMALLAQRLVLCSDLPKETRALATAGVTGRRADEVLEEVASLCAGVPGV
jgi:hypothetical protein